MEITIKHQTEFTNHTFDVVDPDISNVCPFPKILKDASNFSLLESCFSTAFISF